MLANRRSSLIIAMGALGSCSEAPTTPPALDQSTAASVRAFIPSEAHSAAIKLARLIALNIGLPEIRTAIRDGLRASPYAEHRLRIADFLRSFQGSTVAQRVETTAADRGYPEIATLQTSMGVWDIYVHRDIKRREWRGGPDVLVGAGWEGIDQVVAFDADGERADFDPRIGWPNQTVVLLVPAEVLIPRVFRQPDTPGSVIQEATDGRFAAGATTRE